MVQGMRVSSAAVLGFLAQLSGAADWLPVDEGVEYVDVAAETARGEIEVTAVRVDPARVRVEVVSSIAIVEAAGRPPYPAYSLREIADAAQPVAAINGGYIASFAYPLPAGLVLDRGTLHGRFNSLSTLQSGVLCLEDDVVSVVEKEDYRTSACRSALQAGPRVVEKGGVSGIRAGELERPPFRRSLACVDRRGMLLLVRTSRAHLYDVAEILRRTDAPGFACDTALNLTGDTESGMIFDSDGGQRIRGSIRSTLASAILVFRQ